LLKGASHGLIFKPSAYTKTFLPPTQPADSRKNCWFLLAKITSIEIPHALEMLTSSHNSEMVVANKNMQLYMTTNNLKKEASIPEDGQ
jgi:hypothetical protein